MTLKTMILGCAALAVLSTPELCTAQQPPGPGPEHEKLKELVGTWDSEMSGEEMPTSKGVVTYRMALGGMWVESDYKGEINGQPFIGRGMDSYDASQKEYTSVWMDSTSGAPTVFRGNYDETGKVLTMHAESVDPTTGEPLKMKSVSTMEDADHMGFTMFVVVGGQEVPVMTIKYTRRK